MHQLTLIGEEVAATGMRLDAIVTLIADMVCARAANNLHHGVVVVPEGLVDFLPQMRELVQELNEVFRGASSSQIHKSS
jgi:pyrophosphate--fructose-6-phosphate 1-phosphotransferase